MVFIIVLNMFLVYRLLVSEQSVFAYLDLKAQYSEMGARIADLDQQSLELSREIRLLASDGPYIERMIRQEMHFVRENEVLYLLSGSPAGDPSGALPDDE